MKILFLDIDGVLNCKDDFSVGKGSFVICDRKMDRLRDILRETDARFVLSSSWRMSRDHVDFLRERMGPWFYDHFVHATKPYTPNPRVDSKRGHEIDWWLRANDTKDQPVTAYAIVDDDPHMMTHQIPHFVETSFDSGGGLLPTHAVALMAILNRDHTRNPHNGHLEFR